MTDDGRQRFASQELHREIVILLRSTEREDATHEGMADARRDLRLVGKHARKLAIVRQVWMNALDGAQLLEPLDGAIQGQVDRGHPARSELAHYLIGAQTHGWCAKQQRGGGSLS